MNDDPLNALQNLPNLLELKISEKAYNGEQLHFKIGGFPKLKKLSLLHLHVLNSLMIDEGALPILEILSIGLCLELKVVPSGIYHLRNLKELRFHDMPQEFEEGLDPEQGQRYWIVEHVPIVYLTHKVRIGYYGFEAHILCSKRLMGSEGQTINQNDDHNENDSNNINA